MEGEAAAAASPGGSIAALFALVALVVGLFSRRLRMAVIWSAVFGTSCLLLFFGLLLAYSPDIQLTAAAYGHLFGYGLFTFLFGLLGYGIRRCLALIISAARRSQTGAPRR